MMASSQSTKLLAERQELVATLENKLQVNIDGNSLHIASLVAVSRFKVSPHIENLSAEVIDNLKASVQFVEDELARGHSIYGVNTGFGGSANTTTSACNLLQVALLQMQTSAVLPVSESSWCKYRFPYRASSPVAEQLAKLAMPEAWVRGAILIRANSLVRGHSGVRLEIIKTLVKLLQHDLVPLVPLRGSITASGDLCPLSYVAATLEGNPDISVWSGPAEARVLIPADKALESIDAKPLVFGPKESLGLLNGTAFGLSAATLCHYEADTLMILTQIMTAMSVEAFLGNVESFDPFIAAVRPHKGQVECARNILSFLKGSKLATRGHDEVVSGELRQDRYALRTSSQWLGPVLEDMALAREQLAVELNSTTDNPLISTSNRRIYHGGNFQGLSITSSTEKTRLGLEKVGKLLFALSSELLNVHLVHNLPPNLAADEPSLSYTMKGVDINMAAYYSELSAVAGPVSNHVQSAEMANQSVNSLGLISARATHLAIDVVSLMVSAYLYCVCQALDLRAMDRGFVAKLEPEIRKLETVLLGQFIEEKGLEDLHGKLWPEMQKSWAGTTTKDSFERFHIVALSVQHLVVTALNASPTCQTRNHLKLVDKWTTFFASTCKTIFILNRERYLACPDATPFLGSASEKMYNFVRMELDVPMHKGLIDHPTYVSEGVNEGEKGCKREKVTTGTQIARIYRALREERMIGVVMECLRDIDMVGQRNDSAKL